MTSSTADPVTAPAHYAGDGEVDCKRALNSMLAGYAKAAAFAEIRSCGAMDYPVIEFDLHVMPASYWCGAALKYLWRWPLKNGLEDLRKARECIDLAIEEAEGE